MFGCRSFATRNLHIFKELTDKELHIQPYTKTAQLQSRLIFKLVERDGMKL